VTDGLARDREVILFNNAGISSSGGETPNTIAEMAQHAATFIDALALQQIDLNGARRHAAEDSGKGIGFVHEF
jgi:hypothetical protein